MIVYIIIELRILPNEAALTMNGIYYITTASVVGGHYINNYISEQNEYQIVTLTRVGPRMKLKVLYKTSTEQAQRTK